MTVKAIRYAHNAGYPQCHVTTDRGEAIIGLEQKLLDGRHGVAAVALGPPLRWEDFAITLPAAPDEGRREPLTLEAFTSDPAIVALAWRFIRDVNAGVFEPGPVSLAE